MNNQSQELTQHQLEKQKRIAEALQALLKDVESGKVEQLCFASTLSTGECVSAVITSESNYVTMLGLLDMCKMEVIGANLPDASEYPEDDGHATH